jgi:hypothetical protein
MKRLFIFGLILLQLVALGGGVAGGDVVVEVSENGQYLVFQGETIVLIIESQKISADGTFDIELGGYFSQFKTIVFQDEGNGDRDRNDKQLEQETDNTLRSLDIERGRTVTFFFEMEINYDRRGRCPLTVKFIETTNSTNSKMVPITLIVLKPWTKIETYINKEIKETFPNGDEEVLFVFPNQPVVIVVSSPTMKNEGTFLITIEKDPDELECKGYEDGEMLAKQDNGRYSSKIVGAGETRNFRFEITVLEVPEPKVVQLKISIAIEGDPLPPVEKTYKIHILPVPKESIKEFIENKIDEKLPQTETPPEPEPDANEKKVKYRYVLSTIPVFIFALLLFLYQRILISNLKEENRRLKTKFNADHEILREIMEKL